MGWVARVPADMEDIVIERVAAAVAGIDANLGFVEHAAFVA